MKSCAFLPALLVVVLPQPAYAGEPAVAENGAQSEGGGEIDQLHLPGYGGRRSGSSAIELEIAPEIASHNPLGSASRTSSSTSTALTFITSHQLTDRLEVEFDAGPSLFIEDGDVAESSLAASMELRTRQSGAGFAGFARYEIARNMEDFFGSGLDTAQTLTAGLRYGTNLGAGAIGFELAPRWVNSTHDVDDYFAGELFVDASFPVTDSGISLIGELAVDRRWYLNPDPGVQGKRRDWRFETFLGVDFADALAPAGRNPLRSVGVGVLWLKVDSNLDSAERSTFKFLPAITVGASL